MNPHKTKTFPVPGGIAAHGTTHTEIVMREPSFGDYMALSDPYLLTFSEGGNPMLINQPQVLQQYVERCLVEPKDYLLVETQAGFAVAREISAWMMQFFRQGEAGATSADSPTSQKSSSSSSTSTPAP